MAGLVFNIGMNDHDRACLQCWHEWLSDWQGWKHLEKLLDYNLITDNLWPLINPYRYQDRFEEINSDNDGYICIHDACNCYSSLHIYKKQVRTLELTYWFPPSVMHNVIWMEQPIGGNRVPDGLWLRLLLHKGYTLSIISLRAMESQRWFKDMHLQTKPFSYTFGSWGVTTGYILPIGHSALLPWIQT